MSKYLAVEIVDVTFNDWWRVYGRSQATIQKALDRTRKQIGGPFPPSYVPPPLRSPGPAPATKKPVASEEVGQTVGDNLGPQDFEKYRQNSSLGIGRIRAELLALDKAYELDIEWSRIPPAVQQQLLLLPCQTDPAVQKQMAQNVIQRNREAIDAFNEPLTGPGFSNPRPGRFMTLAEYEARKAMFLQDLKFMTESPIGAGAYGLHRAAGGRHEDSMKVAKAVQNAFDLVSARADAHAAREGMHDSAIDGRSPLKDPSAEVSPGWPYTSPSYRESHRP